MIKKITLNNVRIFEGKDFKFDLAPLSIFCGTNSSGKSTILKTLLLLRQSQSHSEIYGRSQGRLRFVGTQVDLGSYSAFVSRNDTTRDIHIAITIENEMPRDMYLELMKVKGFKLAAGEENIKGFLDYSLDCSFIFTASIKGKIIADVSPNHTIIKGSSEESQDLPIRGILKSADYKITVNMNTLASWKVKLVEDRKRQGEEFYEIRIPKNEYLSDQSGKSYFPKQLDRIKNIVGEVILDGLLPYDLVIKRKVAGNKRRRIRLSLPLYLLASLQDLKNELTGINYLGPLRTPAERYYITTFDITPDLDATGKFLPYILGDIVEEPKVINVPPGKNIPSRELLSSALNKWLQYFRTGDIHEDSELESEIKISTSKGILVELAIKSISGGDIYSLADSGFGYSQVLPIIVRGLLASPNNTLIIEQPELHLNPALQVRLAEFFVAMVYAGKHIIIETHSEHIVNTIRVHAAEDLSGELASKAEIFYIDVEQGLPFIHELSIRPDGSVPEWPIHFFGEAANLTGRLLRAQKRKRENDKEKE